MKSIIEEFYYGNLEPQEMNNSESSAKLKKKLRQLAESEAKLTAALSGDEKEAFLRYINQHNEFSALSCADSFATGFKMGAKFSLEMFS